MLDNKTNSLRFSHRPANERGKADLSPLLPKLCY
jgi:hypothetical protein